jgi:hypothetical protein
MKIIFKIFIMSIVMISLWEVAQARKYDPGLAARKATTGDYKDSEAEQLLKDMSPEWKREHRAIVREVMMGTRNKKRGLPEKTAKEEEKLEFIKEGGEEGEEEGYKATSVDAIVGNAIQRIAECKKAISNKSNNILEARGGTWVGVGKILKELSESIIGAQEKGTQIPFESIGNLLLDESLTNSVKNDYNELFDSLVDQLENYFDTWKSKLPKEVPLKDKENFNQECITCREILNSIKKDSGNSLNKGLFTDLVNKDIFHSIVYGMKRYFKFIIDDNDGQRSEKFITEDFKALNFDEIKHGDLKRIAENARGFFKAVADCKKRDSEHMLDYVKNFEGFGYLTPLMKNLKDVVKIVNKDDLEEVVKLFDEYNDMSFIRDNQKLINENKYNAWKNYLEAYNAFKNAVEQKK